MSDPLVEEGDQQFVLYGIGWDQYVTIDDALPDGRGPRMIYVDGCLTFLKVSGRHKWFAYHLDAIITSVALVCGIEQEIGGSATYRLESEQVGLEGDRTYYFGRNAKIMRGPIDIDLTTQPPPDLAIEVEVTHPADQAIAAYARIGVPEVWHHDAQRGKLTFLVLGKDRSYRSAGRSRSLPKLTTQDVLSQLRLAEDSRSFTRWSAQLPEWVRTTILPRSVEG